MSPPGFTIDLPFGGSAFGAIAYGWKYFISSRLHRFAFLAFRLWLIYIGVEVQAKQQSLVFVTEMLIQRTLQAPVLFAVPSPLLDSGLLRTGPRRPHQPFPFSHGISPRA